MPACSAADMALTVSVCMAGVKRRQPLTDEQEEEEEERTEAAVELVAEMQLTAEQLKVSVLCKIILV